MCTGRTLLFRLAILLSLAAISGCYEYEPPPQLLGEEYRPVVVIPDTVTPKYDIVGRSVRGRPIVAQELGSGASTTFVLATIHGNEPAGTPLVRRLAKHLQHNPALLEGRRVVVLPIANPDGMAMGNRTNVRGVDLNRNFAAKNRINSGRNGHRALSEPEARAIEDIIAKYQPARIVSVHQPLSCIDYDGPAEDLAKRMAQNCDLPIKKLGARAGSLGSYAGVTKGIPIVTLELTAGDSQIPEEALWTRYGKTLLSAVLYPEVAK